MKQEWNNSPGMDSRGEELSDYSSRPESNRLTALICGGWPPLGAPYTATLAATENLASSLPDAQMMVTYFRGLQNWAEREVVSKFTVPRMTFAGSNDIIVDSTTGQIAPIGPLIGQHKDELERMGGGFISWMGSVTNL